MHRLVYSYIGCVECPRQVLLLLGVCFIYMSTLGDFITQDIGEAIHDMGDITGEVTTNEKLSYIWNGKTNRSEAVFCYTIVTDFRKSVAIPLLSGSTKLGKSHNIKYIQSLPYILHRQIICLSITYQTSKSNISQISNFQLHFLIKLFLI